VLGPILGIHIKHARRHNEDPDGEVDGVQHVVEHQGLLHARRHQQHHEYRDDEGDEIRRST